MGQPGNRFVSCVRCEAVCTRETMLFPSLGLAAVNSAPARACVRAVPFFGVGRFRGFIRYFHLLCLILRLLFALRW